MELRMGRKVKLSHRAEGMLEAGRVSSESQAADVNLFSLLQLFIRKRRWIFWITGSFTVLTAVWLFMTPNRFQSYATLLPSHNTDKLADLKRMAGLGSFVTGEENMSELYPVILSSQTIRSVVFDRSYRFEHDNRVVDTTLTEYFGLTELDDKDEQYRSLASITKIAADRKTGVLTLSVETTMPAFSQAIVSAYLEELESFNTYKRKSRAQENVRYLKQQVAVYESKLIAAEDSIESFQKANRNWAGSTIPEIIKALARHRRDVEINARTFGLLKQEHVLARIEAQNDVPIVRLLDEPTLPTEKSGPFRLRKIVTMAMISFFGTLFVLLVIDTFRRHSRGPNQDSYLESRNEFARAFPRVYRRATRAAVVPRANIDDTSKVNDPNVPVEL